MTEQEDRSQEKLFQTEPVPGKPGSGRLFDERPVTPEPVECLGMRFESEDARRTYFLDRLKEHAPGAAESAPTSRSERTKTSCACPTRPGTPPAPTRSWPSSWDTMAVRTIRTSRTTANHSPWT